MRKPRTLVVTGLAIGLLALPALATMPTKLVWNASASVPTGLYAVRPIGEITIPDLVVAMPPDQLDQYLVERHYLGRGVPLIKHVEALPGQTVCRTGDTITVDGTAIATARERDRLGRALPVWRGCRTLGDDVVFLLNRGVPDSMDGRYFGPLPRKSIVGQAVPVWTRKGS